MSDALYGTRLRWDSGHGVAKLHGVSVALTRAPVLGGSLVVHVDCTPEVQCFEIRRVESDAMGRMSGDEIRDAYALLVELTLKGHE